MYLGSKAKSTEHIKLSVNLSLAKLKSFERARFLHHLNDTKGTSKFFSQILNQKKKGSFLNFSPAILYMLCMVNSLFKIFTDYYLFLAILTSASWQQRCGVQYTLKLTLSLQQLCLKDFLFWVNWSLFFKPYSNLVLNFLIVVIWSLTFQYHINLINTIIFLVKIANVTNNPKKKKKLVFIDVVIN